ncbi:hypothetical protein [Tuwongella immobilis]|uniref:Uncharacterized protein n=1 Tax=Tuwongella immobilis TaxID=692036 RepID=A0A6C2YIY9_9BACT|nr:hypothetical protein [Tuwongella immobilis]VIP01251.1 Uncharacterized protein OS=Pirellula staleyi (strain ATCC 27377 / DSM 6068 / ICPB 4128) GN=Psta_0753 PE=4 SV=1 [Tuwongella immobilis]VTR97928.1 Uncharacterized protein OS=Pirellula staleyi (strain ATCC 27377 / DSM 6068 / ICPB 4128) GN=Psta_0753 PE=4 SV=1 [Tuwongella immobilis]
MHRLAMRWNRGRVTGGIGLVLVMLSTLALRGDDDAPTRKREAPGNTVLSAEMARQRVGERIRVRITVNAAKDRLEKRGEIYLDSEADFKSEKNFAIVISKAGAKSHAKAGILAPAEHYRGKTIIVSGTVGEVDGVPRMDVDDAKQIVIEPMPMAPMAK